MRHILQAVQKKAGGHIKSAKSLLFRDRVRSQSSAGVIFKSLRNLPLGVIEPQVSSVRRFFARMPARISSASGFSKARVIDLEWRRAFVSVVTPYPRIERYASHTSAGAILDLLGTHSRAQM